MGDSITDHAREVSELWAAYARGENTRVPITFACDEQVWLKVCGRTFGEFYRNPEAHLAAQLEGKRWFHENVVGDMAPGLPERWVVGVQLWMEENESFGCEVSYQENDYAWARPLPLEREELLRHLSDLDPEERVRRGSAFRMWQALKELADGMRFLDRPVDVAPPGGGTHGVFTKAAEIRGIERLCLDLYEAPQFVDDLLRLVTEKTIGRIRAWHRLTRGREAELPIAGGWSLADDSLQLLSPQAYERFVLPWHERLYSTMATGARGMHLCGRSSQHYELLRRRLNVTALDGPGPFVDHGRYLQTLGPGLSLAAQTDHSILAKGSPGEIEAMMRGLLRPAARVPGRFQVMGFLLRETPLESVRLCYQYGRRYGGTDAGDGGAQ